MWSVSGFTSSTLITDGCFGPVSLAIASHHSTGEEWIVASDEPTSVETFDEYSLRFDIEENFLDDKSNGFQLESSRIRSAKALERLCLVLAMATLYLVSQGTAVVTAGKRRLVDPHWFRGNSYLKIGWKWVKRALVQGEMLTRTLFLDDQPDPELAISSKDNGTICRICALPSHFSIFQPLFLVKTLLNEFCQSIRCTTMKQ